VEGTATVHLDLLRTIHNSTCIDISAATFNRSYPAYEIKSPIKTGGNGLAFSA
jgi:hypothetical protein